MAGTVKPGEGSGYLLCTYMCSVMKTEREILCSGAQW